MANRHVASKKNREAAGRSRVGYGGNGTSRARRIENQLATTGVIRGDVANRQALKAADSRLTQQQFGTRNQQAMDIRAAFGVYG